MPQAFSSIPSKFEVSTPAPADPQNDSATHGGGIVTPVPQWRRGPHAPLCSFDGGTRFSLSVTAEVAFCHWGPRVLEALAVHEQTREPVPLGDGVQVRGASADELGYFSDYPHEGGVCFVSDEFRVILRRSVLDGVLSEKKNDAVCILGWRAFVENSSVQAAFERVCVFLRHCGLVPTLQAINRLDVNATVDDVPMSMVRDAFHGGFFWTRATPGLHEGTVYFGRRDSAVLFRAYDKTAELRCGIDSVEAREKFRFLARYFPPESLAHLTRFEFELHRKELERFSVSDFRDLEKKLLAILKRLLCNWLSVRETSYKKDRADRHRGRNTAAPFWANLSQAFESFAVSVSADQIHVQTRRQGRTTGEKSLQTSKRYLRIMAEESFRVRREYVQRDIEWRKFHAKNDPLYVPETVSDVEIWKGVFSDLVHDVSSRFPSMGEGCVNPRELLTRYCLEEFEDVQTNQEMAAQECYLVPSV